MKPKFDKVSVFSMLFILFLISIPGFLVYYMPDWRSSSQSPEVAQRQAHPEFQENAGMIDNRIVLKKDKSITVNRNRLVFKGLKNEKVHLDIYLLELDPESAYPHYMSQADTEKVIRCGDSTFQLLKVSDDTLQLRIVDLYSS